MRLIRLINRLHTHTHREREREREMFTITLLCSFLRWSLSYATFLRWKLSCWALLLLLAAYVISRTYMYDITSRIFLHWTYWTINYSRYNRSFKSCSHKMYIFFLVCKRFHDDGKSQPNWWRNRRHQRQAQCSYSVDLSRKTLARQLSGNRKNRKTVVEHPSKTSELPWDSLRTRAITQVCRGYTVRFSYVYWYHHTK